MMDGFEALLGSLLGIVLLLLVLWTLATNATPSGRLSCETKYNVHECVMVYVPNTDKDVIGKYGVK